MVLHRMGLRSLHPRARRLLDGPCFMANCRVPGCRADLSSLKQYYVRHKVRRSWALQGAGLDRTSTQAGRGMPPARSQGPAALQAYDQVVSSYEAARPPCVLSCSG